MAKMVWLGNGFLDFLDVVSAGVGDRAAGTGCAWHSLEKRYLSYLRYTAPPSSQARP
jgi:hypothetical protein